MAAIEPGELFTITYGKHNRRLEVVALNGRQRRRAIQCLATLREAKQPEQVLPVLDELDAVTRMCVPSMTDELMDTLDDALQVQIIGSVIMRAALSEDESKKSE